MRILSVGNSADIYGASRCMLRLFGRFVRGGHEVHVVLPEQGPLIVHLEAAGIHVHIQPDLSVFDRKSIGSVASCLHFMIRFPISVTRLVVLLLRHRFDVVHTNTATLPSAAIAAALTRTPHVWHIRELFAEFSTPWILYQRFISAMSAAIIAISICVSEQFNATIRKKVIVIYDGLDETDRDNPDGVLMFRSRFPKDKLLVGVVGRIKWHRKGQEVLVRSAVLLKDRQPDVHYVIVGTSAPGNEDHERRLREFISECSLDSTVTMAGDTHDPMSVFAALDIAVVPSVQPEPFGLVVIEAMSIGTPVVGSACGGIVEQIVDGTSGLLFTPGDSEALACALDRLLRNESLREQLVEGGFARVRSAFTIDETYRLTSNLFSEVICHVPRDSCH